MSDSTAIKEVSNHHLGRIYYIFDFLKKCRIAETVSNIVSEVDDTKKTLLGQIFEIMVINRLYGLRTPIYHIGEWYENTALPEIYGIKSDQLKDDRIGRFLDKIYPHLASIDSQITLNIIREFGIDISQIHFDPSSFNVYGDYIATAGEPPVIQITYGRDGQGNKDNKLVRFGIAISEDKGFPLIAKCYSGNTNDSEMHPEFLKELRDTITTSNFLLVADTKLDTKKNISDIIDHKGFFLCPGVFAPELKKAYIEKYNKKYKLETLDYVSKKEIKKPKTKRQQFKAFEKVQKIVIKKGKKERTYQYRLIFVYSPTKAKTQALSRDKMLSKVKSELDRLISNMNTNRKGYKTHDGVMKKFRDITERYACKKFFNVEIKYENELYTLSYSLKQEEIDKDNTLQGLYILKTNLPKKEYSLDDVLTIYKKQHLIENRIADIKGPLQVTPVYLEKPERIVSLFMIIFQALKIYTLVEREVHQSVEKKGKPIPILPENRMSSKPKTSSIFRVLDESNISLIIITFQDNSKKLYISPLTPKQKMLFEFVEREPPDWQFFLQTSSS